MKIVIVLGASGSGKTTYIENTLIKDSVKEDFMMNGLNFCKTQNTLLFGHYNVDRRCKGCDTLSMTAINDIIKSLQKLISENQYEQIVLDGDRINCKKMHNFLLPYKEQVEIIWVDTDFETINERLPNINKVFYQTTLTKTKNMIGLYRASQFNIQKITTKKVSRWF